MKEKTPEQRAKAAESQRRYLASRTPEQRKEMAEKLRLWKANNRALLNQRLRDWRKKNPEKSLARRRRDKELHRAKSPEKDRARNVLRNAVSRGHIVKPTECSDCGAAGLLLHGHHDDYSKPLDVRWVCGPCHHKIHHPNRGSK